jgi:hypothetical protein
MRGGRIHIGKITPPPAGNEDFLTRPRGVVDHQNALSTLPGGQSAHEACATGTKDNRVIDV